VCGFAVLIVAFARDNHVMVLPLDSIVIPSDLLPADGRFGSGPSRIRQQQVADLASSTAMGTSHRKDPVVGLVASVREQLATLFTLPRDWTVVVGNGGASTFWDVASFGLIRERSQHLVFGEFSQKFADVVAASPHLGDPIAIQAPVGTVPELVIDNAVDTVCLTHNETSTGARAVLAHDPTEAVILVDATSAAGAMPFNPDDADVYYFSPQKAFGSDGGTWFALCSPRALERNAQLHSRWSPKSLDLGAAIEASKKNQTYNTPAIATFVLMDSQLRWMLDNGGLAWCVGRVEESARHLYGWAEASSFARPFVSDPQHRSPVVATIDLDDVDAGELNAVLRRNGIVDTDAYRNLGRNQIRVGLFPSVDPSDVELLTASIDYVAERLA
jgi:phosphoserine aminotransferase